MTTDLPTIRAEAASIYAGLAHRHTHTPDQAAAATKVIELFLLAFKYHQYAEVRKLVAPDYKQHDQSVGTGRESIIDFAKNMRAEQIAKGVDPKEPGYVHIEYKRIFVDGEYVVPHMHIVRFPGDEGLQGIEPLSYKDGVFREHWACLQPIPKPEELRNPVF